MRVPKAIHAKNDGKDTCFSGFRQIIGPKVFDIRQNNLSLHPKSSVTRNQ